MLTRAGWLLGTPCIMTFDKSIVLSGPGRWWTVPDCVTYNVKNITSPKGVTIKLCFGMMAFLNPFWEQVWKRGEVRDKRTLRALHRVYQTPLRWGRVCEVGGRGQSRFVSISQFFLKQGLVLKARLDILPRAMDWLGNDLDSNPLLFISKCSIFPDGDN